MSRKIRMEDIAEATSWHFGTGLHVRPASRRVIEARRCAYAACLEVGFSYVEIARKFKKDRSTVIAALNNGHRPDPKDVAAVLRNARLRAHADQDVLA